MKYFARSIVEYIVNESQKSDVSLRFVLPSYPADLLLEIGKGVREAFFETKNKMIRFEYAVAYELGNTWKTGNELENAIFSEVVEQGWWNETDNMTSLRHLSKTGDEDCLVVVMAGYDHITDQSSLEDFFHLNQEMVWEICLEKSFISWVETALVEHINLDGNEQGMDNIAELFNQLYNIGLADPLAISRYLDDKDFSVALDGKDAYRAVLKELGQFGLPNLVGFQERGRRGITDYLINARKFVTYNRFLDVGNRNRAIRTIDKFINKQVAPVANTLGVFANQNELIGSLRNYIDTASPLELKKLMTADFVYINDSILGYRELRTRNTKPREIKLRGNAVEVFLHALWRTLAEFKKESKSIVAWEEIGRIDFVSHRFVHHFDNEDSKAEAQAFLTRLLGGIDKYLEENLFIGPENSEAVVKSALCPKDKNEIAYNPAKGMEPRLQFEIIVTGKSDEQVTLKFAWLLGKNSQARFLVELYDWVQMQYRNAETKNIFLPVFAVKYMNEIFMAKEAEDVIRILNQGMEKSALAIKDLMTSPCSNLEKVLMKRIFELTNHYQMFLGEYSRDGFFIALDGFDALRRAYQRLFEEYLEQHFESNLGAQLMKAFFILPQQYTEMANWRGRKYLQCGIVTPLHPALLQMIHHQHSYLCKSFNNEVNRGLREIGQRGMALGHWYRVIDLSDMKWPVLGVLQNNSELDVNVRGHGYVHLVGSPEEKYSTASSKLLIEYEDGDDAVSDTELLRETQEAKLIKQILADYCKLHPYACDGLSIGAYCGGPIQHLVSGLDAFLADRARERMDVPFSLKLILFSDRPDDMSLLRWVNAWKNRWQTAEEGSKKGYYSNCLISVSYRVIPEDDLEQLARQIQMVDMDILFFSDFTKPLKNDFFPIKDTRLFKTSDADYSKFPILEKTSCLIRGEAATSERKLVLSNRQFKLGALHSEVMVRLRAPFSVDNQQQHIVVSTTEFHAWAPVLDVAHKNCVWVVCIDSVVDEKLVRRRRSGGAREIIGFGTGVGPHGEFNFTVSTEQFNLADIVTRIGDQLKRLVPNYDLKTCQQLARKLMDEASSMPGLSVVKAAGLASEYIREFIAYALVRRLLPKENGILCDEIVALDAFLHWFDFAPQDRRPDLIRLQARNEGGTIKLKAQLIECKLAKESEGYLEKALSQVEEGLKHLVPRFWPRGEEPIGTARAGQTQLPCEQRYWWVQLHRLVTSRSEISKKHEREVVQALEYLSDGHYSIEWEAAIVAFWVDVAHGEMNKNIQGTFTIEDQQINIFSITAGRDVIRDVGFGKREFEIFDGTSVLRYQHAGLGHLVSVEPDEDGALEKDDESAITEEVCVKGPKDKVGVERTFLKIPDRILLGSGTRGGRDIFWEFGHPELPNRHLLIFGASGTGKTYTIQAIIAELSMNGINSLIVDYSSGFTRKQLEPMIVEKLFPTQHIVRKEPLPINPFRQQCDYIDDIPLPDTPANIAQRVTGVFSEVFTLGEQQKAILYDAIKTGVEEDSGSFNLRKLMVKIENIKDEGGVLAVSATTVLNKLKPFVEMDPFGDETPESWERIFLDSESRCHILQLAGFMKDAGQLITEFSLIDLYWYYKTRGMKDQPRVIVLDEIQNLDHRLESPLGQFLTEGRKFGVSLVLATQTLSNFNRDERSRLFQASQKLFFKPADTEIKSFAQLLADATNENLDYWVHQLSGLKLGECFALGYAYNPGLDRLEVNKAFKIKIKALEERFGKDVSPKLP